MKKIALNFIMKGTEEPSQIVKMLSSIAPYVDAIYCTATWDVNGRAVKIARSFGAEVSFFEWIKDFAAARNFALAQVPDKYEYIFWCDTDDVIVGGEHIRRYIELDKDRYFINYNYTIDEKTGEALVVHPKERILRKSLFVWKAALHEVPIPLNSQISQEFIREIVVNHYPTKENIEDGFKRNLEILEKTYQEEGNEHDPKTVYYLARSYFDLNNYQKAEEMFWQYLAGKNPSGWDEERAMAYNYLGLMYTALSKLDDARSCFHMAMDEKPEFPTWYINLGVTYAKIKDWDKCIFWTSRGLKMPQPKTAMILSPRDDLVRGWSVLYDACMQKRKLKEAFSIASELCKIFPDDKFFEQRRVSVYNVMRWTEMSKNIKEIAEECRSLDEAHKIRALLLNLPSTIADNAYIENLKQAYIVPETWPKKSIAYYCGRSVESWDETSLEKGIGGSETAVIALSRFWAKRGWKVTVFGLPFEEHRDKYGVDWKMYWRFNPRDNFDVFIGWRAPSLFKEKIKARVAAIDLHDVIQPQDYSPTVIANIDKIFVKSKFQASIAPHIPREKLEVITNGYVKDFLPNLNKVKRDPYKIIYCSSYDRGLELMLKWGWPLIKEQIPQAELHIYYGWNTFDNFFAPSGIAPNRERMAWKAKMMELIKQDGVYEHGRISQKELLLKKAESSIHYYATDFDEIDCISVRESAAVGCIPITSNFAALSERGYCNRVEGNPRDKRIQEAIARTVVGALRNGPQKDYREAIQTLARKESWEEVAKKWLEVFGE